MTHSDNTLVLADDEPATPCSPSPCGSNAICKERNGAGSCTCLPDYFGDPYSGCRPECVTNNDCAREKACSNQRCKDPCPGICGPNAECRVVNHAPSCSCLAGLTGDPWTSCHEPPPPPSKNQCLKEIKGLNAHLLIFKFPFRLSNKFLRCCVQLLNSIFVLNRFLYITHSYTSEFEDNLDPCYPSPCGMNSQCRVTNGHAVCSCLPGYIGSAPNCRPECVVSSECSQDKACINKKCTDPCPGTCGQNARCQTISHNPICSCSAGFTGDPFVRCIYAESKSILSHICTLYMHAGIFVGLFY